MIYSISRGMKPIEVESKSSLPVGTVLQLEGYDCPKYVIVRNLGIDSRFASYGSKYITLNPETLDIRQHEASGLEWLKNKRDSRIQVYITDEIMPEARVQELYAMASDLQADCKSY